MTWEGLRQSWESLKQSLSEMSWGDLGEILSGIGTLIIALYAALITTRITLQQNRKQWVDDFRALYAEFWNDKDVSEVRRWIISGQIYDDVLKPVLERRNKQTENRLNEEDSLKLDKLDKFLSVLIRLQTAERTHPLRRKHSTIRRLIFSEYWITQAVKRYELTKYIKENWTGELDYEKYVPKELKEQLGISSNRWWRRSAKSKKVDNIRDNHVAQ